MGERTDVVYRGYGNDNPAGGRLVTVTRNGLESPLRHVIRHSPTGMTWGYAGSGPADLARSILIDALAAAARCPSCEDAHRVLVRWLPDRMTTKPWSPSAAEAAAPDADVTVETCYDCDDGYVHLPYQAFKFEIIAGLDDSWTLTRDEVMAWLSVHRCKEESWRESGPAKHQF